MIETTHVEEFAKKTWLARNEGALRGDEYDLARGLHSAIALDLHEHPDLKYNPERDARVKWAREIIEAKTVTPSRMPMAAPELEATMRWLMTGKIAEPCGKDYAAGEH